MIVLVHNRSKVVRISSGQSVNFDPNAPIGEVLFDLALRFPDEVLVWVCEDQQKNLNAAAIEELLHHKKLLLFFNPYEKEFLNPGLGYVDMNSLLHYNKKVAFPSIQVSAAVGAVHAETLNAMANQHIGANGRFEYMLQSIAQRAALQGLICISEPKLLISDTAGKARITQSDFTLFRFVKQHRKIHWVMILFFNILIYEKRFPILPLLYSLAFRKRKWDPSVLDAIEVKSTRKISETNSVDVVIPTIGRAEHVYNVVKDLKNQTHLPQKVILVEQNPIAGSQTELDFIISEKWPFEIEHVFTHQPGVCNARNRALSKVKSEWVFLCDDDNRFDPDVLENALEALSRYGTEGILTDYTQPGESHSFAKTHQTTIFGGGNAFFKAKYIPDVSFDQAYEFTYGEDYDFGMQLRNLGVDILFVPEIKIIHLKARMGGFRIKPVLKWSNDAIQPKPSPPILLNILKHGTKQQYLGFKTLYFLKLLKGKDRMNPFKYYRQFKQNWKASEQWAYKLLAAART